MYKLQNKSNFCKIDEKVFYLTPKKRKKIWLCNSITVTNKASNSAKDSPDIIIKFKNPDKILTEVTIKQKLINVSGVSLAKKLASHGLFINPGYEKQLSQYIEEITSET